MAEFFFQSYSRKVFSNPIAGRLRPKPTPQASEIQTPREGRPRGGGEDYVFSTDYVFPTDYAFSTGLRRAMTVWSPVVACPIFTQTSESIGR